MFRLPQLTSECSAPRHCTGSPRPSPPHLRCGCSYFFTTSPLALRPSLTSLWLSCGSLEIHRARPAGVLTVHDFGTCAFLFQIDMSELPHHSQIKFTFSARMHPTLNCNLFPFSELFFFQHFSPSDS